MSNCHTWLIYALGGGWGHLNRALALGRVAARDRNITILTNSPYVAYLPKTACESVSGNSQGRDCGIHEARGANLFRPLESRFRSLSRPLPAVDRPNCQVCCIPSDTNFEDICDRVQQILQTSNYECLIIDTFPRGLGGELAEILPSLAVPKVLIHRDLNPKYIQKKNLEPFVAHFDLILIPGEGQDSPLANFPQVKHTAPWLIRSSDELPSPKMARSLLRLHCVASTAIVAILASGKEEELSLYGNLTRSLAESNNKLAVRCISPVQPPNCPRECWVYHYPAFECLRVANVVVGGGGYNTVSECQALGIPLVSFAFKRLYDRQRIRLQKLHRQHPTAIVGSIADAIAAIYDFLDWNITKPSPSFDNGAVDAVVKIELLSK